MRGKPLRVSPLAFNHPPAGDRFCAAKSRLQKNTTTLWVVVFFWSGRRGSNSLPGIPRMAVAIRRSPASPLDLTRFAQVEAASPSLPATFQKENTILTDGVSFCDCPQVLLSALPPTARKGECEGETFAGFPTRVQSSARRRSLLRSKSAAPKKKRHTFVCLFFFGAGDEARTRYLDLGKVALYQMSYARKRRRCCGTLVPPVGVEPTTRGFSVRCSTN